MLYSILRRLCICSARSQLQAAAVSSLRPHALLTLTPCTSHPTERGRMRGRTFNDVSGAAVHLSPALVTSAVSTPAARSMMQDRTFNEVYGAASDAEDSVTGPPAPPGAHGLLDSPLPLCSPEGLEGAMRANALPLADLVPGGDTPSGEGSNFCRRFHQANLQVRVPVAASGIVAELAWLLSSVAPLVRSVRRRRSHPSQAFCMTRGPVAEQELPFGAGATSNWGGGRRDSVNSRRSSFGADVTGHLLDADVDLDALDFPVSSLASREQIICLCEPIIALQELAWSGTSSKACSRCLWSRPVCGSGVQPSAL